MVDLGASQKRYENAVKLYDKRKAARLRASEQYNRTVRLEQESKEALELQRDILMSNAVAVSHCLT